MILRLRRTHALVWSLLAVLLPAILAMAWIYRRPSGARNEWPESVASRLSPPAGAGDPSGGSR